MTKKKLRIALVASPWRAVPPPKYGGTERVVAYLADGLVRLGHDVTLFATGDSKTRAKLVAIHPKPGLRVDLSGLPFPLEHAAFAFDKIRKGKFDLVHNHYTFWGAAFASSVSVPVVTTYHDDLTEVHKDPGYASLVRLLQKTPMISISDSQRACTPFALNWVGRVYNGILTEEFPFSASHGDYLLWIGRLNPRKGVADAIAVAKATGMRLLLACEFDRKSPRAVAFFNREIKPYLSQKIEYVGEVSGQRRLTLYKKAYALLLPVHWHEPFGLVMTEAMACGTPVIAHGFGAVPEVVENGKTGFITRNVADMVRAVGKIEQIKRQDCRVRVEQYFSQAVMAKNYEDLYIKFLAKFSRE